MIYASVVKETNVISHIFYYRSVCDESNHLVGLVVENNSEVVTPVNVSHKYRLLTASVLSFL